MHIDEYFLMQHVNIERINKINKKKKKMSNWSEKWDGTLVDMHFYVQLINRFTEATQDWLMFFIMFGILVWNLDTHWLGKKISNFRSLEKHQQEDGLREENRNITSHIEYIKLSIINHSFHIYISFIDDKLIELTSFS